MKNEVFFRAGLTLIALIMIISCKDQVLEPDQIDDALLKSGSKGNVENKIRLLENKGLSDGFLQGYRYNEMGLADSFYLSKPGWYNFWATMEYDNNNRMSKARFYYSEEEFYDIVLTWEKDKLVKETWYVPGTKDTVDYYENFYNKKGQLVKRDNPPWNWYSLYYYDHIGNITKTEINFNDGSLYFGIEFSYSTRIKNPFTAIPGWPVTLFFIEWNDCSPNRFTGVKGYDDNVVYYNWESAETVLKAGLGNYAVYQNSRDVVNDEWTDQTWTYEKSSGKSESHHHSANFDGKKGNSTNPDFYKLKHKPSKQNRKGIIFRH